MISTLLTYLKYEQQLLGELVNLAARQQEALIKYRISDLELITSLQAEASNNLRAAEDQRIGLIMKWFGMSRKEAMAVNISFIESRLGSDDLPELKAIKSDMNDLSHRLVYLNTLNRVLTNKALGSVGKMLSLFTNGTNYVCNVKI